MVHGDRTQFKTRTGFPAGTLGITAARAFRARAATSLAGIRAGGSLSIAFPGALFRRAQWLDRWKRNTVLRAFIRLPLRGQRRLGSPWRRPLLLPVELRHANHTASTNVLILDGKL
jgi:hypothetical protein